MKKSILVIGGAGYIGSHMVRTLLEAGYQPVVFDNLSTGHQESVPEQAIFVQGDLQKAEDVERVFKQFIFSGIMHFAASSIVPESVKKPLQYYRNNVAAFLNLLDQVALHRTPHLIFSSTAAVYGEVKETPIKESSPSQPSNPYGKSKKMMEDILADVTSTAPLNFAILRYFNAAGAHAHGETGESHYPETHLIPNLLAALAGDTHEFTLFGNDYSTRDGTCVRDYIHVEDLCRAHLLALQYLEKGGTSETFNLGSERGYSVQEIVQAVENFTGKKVPVRVGPKRPGDPAELVADSTKAKKILGWTAREDLKSIIESAHKWHERCHQEEGLCKKS